MLKEKRKELIDYIKKHRTFLNTNAKALDIYNGNLLPYVDYVLKNSLSDTYYNAIRHRTLPINILQRFIDKVSTTYSKAPQRLSQNELGQSFVDYYAKALNINQSGSIADTYSHLFKGFAWEPYVNKNGKPALRELSFDSFLVYSDSEVNPEEETVFLKFLGKKDGDDDSLLIHAYSDTEFDAFYLNGNTAPEYLIENEGLNLYGTIPFVYGKRQKNYLLPTLDTDMLSMATAIPVMITDGAGAQMFQAFSIMYGIDVNSENLSMSPNAFWSLKSDRETDKNPQIGVLTPQADTQKVMEFIVNNFVLWLETKGIRVGSMGEFNSGSLSSGIAKIIDEMDVYELKRKSQFWFTMDEQELWNDKLPKIHNQWIKAGLIKPEIGILPENFDPQVEVKFEEPKPLISRTEQIANIEAELRIGTMNKEQAIKILHPELTDEEIEEILEGEDAEEMDTRDDQTTEDDQTERETANSQDID